MPRQIQVNKTTGFRPDVLNKVVERCETENREWNDMIDELLRTGLGMDIERRVQRRSWQQKEPLPETLDVGETHG